jgi:hypothetical protein
VTSRDEGHDPDNRSDSPPVFANLLPPILGLVGIGVLACAVWASGLTGISTGEDLLRCSAVTDDLARLACYDRLTVPRDPAKGALAPARIFQPEELK